MKRKRERLVCAAAIGLIAGCNNFSPNATTSTAGAKFYAVSAESAAFYRRGPAATTAPDQTLKKGALMTLIRPSFGYCKVKLASGEQGYVASEDIGIASSTLVAAATAPEQSRSARFHFDSSDSRLITPEEPLPEFLPTPIPERADSDR